MYINYTTRVSNAACKSRTIPTATLYFILYIFQASATITITCVWHQAPYQIRLCVFTRKTIYVLKTTTTVDNDSIAAPPLLRGERTRATRRRREKCNPATTRSVIIIIILPNI